MDEPIKEMSIHDLAVNQAKWFESMVNEQRKQTDKLSSINTVLVIFLVIVIFGILVSMCSAMGIRL